MRSRHILILLFVASLGWALAEPPAMMGSSPIAYNADDQWVNDYLALKSAIFQTQRQLASASYRQTHGRRIPYGRIRMSAALRDLANAKKNVEFHLETRTPEMLLQQREARLLTMCEALLNVPIFSEKSPHHVFWIDDATAENGRLLCERADAISRGIDVVRAGMR
jgi:hypothetical protein